MDLSAQSLARKCDGLHMFADGLGLTTLAVFGQAFFNETLREEHTFVEAFHKAAEHISQRERGEKKQASLPQMHVGIAIPPKLAVLERRLRFLAGLAVYL